jgi:hypothetical protein
VKGTCSALSAKKTPDLNRTPLELTDIKSITMQPSKFKIGQSPNQYSFMSNYANMTNPPIYCQR